MRAAAVALLLVGCSTEPEAEAGSTPAEAVVTESLIVASADWTLDWTLGGAEATGEGWSTTSDLGYTVTVDAGWLVAYSLTLSPCEETVAAAPADRLWSLLGVGTARADHPNFEDPSQVEMITAQSLVTPEPWSVETAFEPATYCGLHHLVARGEADTSAPDGTSAYGYSLQASLHWSKDGQEGTFVLASDWANGRDWAWEDVDTVFPDDGAAPEAWHADVVVTRDLARLFDGIELAEATDGQVIWAMLESIFEDADITVTFRAP